MKKIIKIVFIGGVLLGVLFVSLLFYSKPAERSLFLTPVCTLNTTKKIIALTFDDGPSSKKTPKILALLKKYNVKSTFFVLGAQIEKNPKIAKSILAEGHLIGWGKLW